MLADYGFVGLFIVVAVGFSLLLIILPVVFRYLKVVPHNPSPIKNATFECGMETIGKTWVQFNFRYYYYALIFLALDVLVAFIYPWAVSVRDLGTSGFAAIIVFIAIILVGYLYAWRKRVLEWK
ncbi:MAG TPA: NAD(P)H-quinone oxidoreductase subunit 3 [Dehalococcoidia bacterium]|nr:NAD(P)H-quinone oxidoreductase subunit 3 [Dehalococcoidia bacterium]